nr:unnamed protein product [Callosobruchus chinensis]
MENNTPQNTTETAQGNSESKYESILQLLECPVCYNNLSPPLGQCIQGHAVCPSCFDRLARCPVCRSNKSEAAPLLLDQKDHEGICEFAPLFCPLRRLECEWEGNKDDLIDHLKCRHPERIICSDTQNFYCKSVLGDNRLLMVVLFYTHETLFRAYWQFDKRQEQMKFSVCQLDRSKKEEEFFYSFVVLNIHTDEEALKLVTKCVIPSQLQHEAIENNHYVAVHYDILRKSSCELGDVKCKIDIFKKDKVNSVDAPSTSASLEKDAAGIS